MINLQNKSDSKNNTIFPKLKGPYIVGTKALDLIDEARKEDSGSFRELMVQVYYPAIASKPELRPYAPEYLLKAIKALFKPFPSITDQYISELDSVRVHSTYDLPISDKEQSFPLIIFSHGYKASRFFYTAFCEELASNGYIVIAIDHTNDCLATQLASGAVALLKMITNAKEGTDEFYDSFNERIKVRISDIKFVIDQITNWNQSSKDFFYGKIDLNHIGLIGHSLGGASVIQAGLADDRVKAIASLDPFPGGPLISNFTKPLMWFTAQRMDWTHTVMGASDKKVEEFKRQLAAYEKYCKYKVVFRNAGHMVYSDFALLSTLNLFKKLPTSFPLLQVGDVDGVVAIEKIDSYLDVFFDKYLKGKSNFLDENKKEYEI